VVRDNIVLGVFGDYTFGEQDDDFTLSGIATKGELDDIWAVGGRAGIIVHKDLLLYGTVGYTQAELTLSNAAAKNKEDLDGYFVGVGLERLLCSNLYLKGEYRYSDFEDSTGTTTGGCGGSCDVKAENDDHSIRVGLAYKFGARAEEAVPLK
jgi:outer membrane immunogenic protein